MRTGRVVSTLNERDVMRVREMAGMGLLAVVLLLGLGWVVQGNAFFMYKVFAPKTEQVRRQTFEQSRAFNQGMVQELENMQFQYERSDSTGKASMASIILHRASGYDLNDSSVPTSLRSFIADLKENRQ